MIENDLQRKITAESADMFRRGIAEREARGPAPGVHELLHRAEINGMKSMLEELQGQIAEYDARVNKGKQE